MRASGGLVPSYSLFLQSLTKDLGADIQDTLSGTISPSGEAIYRLEVPVGGSLAVNLGGSTNLTAQAWSVPTGKRSWPAAPSSSTAVTQGEVVLLEVLGNDSTAGGPYTPPAFINLDQFENSATRQPLLPGGRYAASSGIAAADLTGNGKTDLVVTSNQTDADTVLKGNGDEHLPGRQSVCHRSRRQLAGGSGNPLVTDLTGNGIPDIVTSNFSGNDVSAVLLGLGNGSFLPQRSRFDANINPDSVVSGDFNGDGIPDLALLNRSSTTETLAILISAATASFKPSLPPITIPFAHERAFLVLAGKLTTNGRDDLVVFGTSTGTFEVLLMATATAPSPTEGRTRWATASTSPLWRTSTATASFRRDLRRRRPDPETSSVCLGNGDGTFQAPMTFSAVGSGAPAIASVSSAWLSPTTAAHRSATGIRAPGHHPRHHHYEGGVAVLQYAALS